MPGELARVKSDVYGLQSCRRLGRRVAELTRAIKAGFKALPREATYWPYGSAAGMKETTGKIKGGKR